MVLSNKILCFFTVIGLTYAETIDLPWSAQEYEPMTIQVGDSINFVYTFGHNVYTLPESAFADCDFAADGAEELQGKGPYLRQFDEAGTFYFGCQVGRHCQFGGQKIIVTVEGAAVPDTPPAEDTPPEVDTPPEADVTEEADTPDAETTTEIIPCTGNKTYVLTFDLSWTEDTTPTGFPGEDVAHFSDFVSATHNSNIYMWRTGTNSSEGMKRLAELGETEELQTELQNAGDDVKEIVISDETTSNIETREITITADGSHSLVSVATMLAPSPDWFIGIRDVELCDTDTGTWKETPLTAVNLLVYDAGTDSGLKFLSEDEVTDPVEVIFLLTGDAPDDAESDFFGNEQPQPFGTVTIAVADE